MPKKVLFIISIILFILSLPLGSKMVLELIHDQKMASQFQIINISEGEPPTDPSLIFESNKIEIKEVLSEEASYVDPWDNKITPGDLSIIINGIVVDQLSGHPVRIEELGLNRYFGEVAYLKVKDVKNKTKQLFIVLKKSAELTKEKPNGDMIGWLPDDELSYKSYAIDEDGTIEEASFGFTKGNRNALQTKLLNKGTLGSYRVGYYTDLWEGYPSIIFPFFYPFITLIIAFISSIILFPYEKFKKGS